MRLCDLGGATCVISIAVLSANKLQARRIAIKQ